MRDLITPIAVAVFGLGTVTMLTLAPKLGDTRVAALFPPGTALERVLEAVVEADGRLVRFGATDFIVVIDGVEGEVARAALLRHAWVLADPLAAGGCVDLRDTQSKWRFTGGMGA